MAPRNRRPAASAPEPSTLALQHVELLDKRNAAAERKADALAQTIREANETLKALTEAIAKAVKTKDEIYEWYVDQVDKTITAAITTGIEGLHEALQEAQNVKAAQIIEAFDRLTRLLMGEEPDHPGESLPVIVKRLSTPPLTDEDQKRVEQLWDTYYERMHALQSGVAKMMEFDDGHTPKQLRVGFNSALVNDKALVDLLIGKKYINKLEYVESVVACLEGEIATYEKQLSGLLGARIKLS